MKRWQEVASRRVQNQNDADATTGTSQTRIANPIFLADQLESAKRAVIEAAQAIA